MRSDRCRDPRARNGLSRPSPGAQAAHSLQIGWPPTSLASWLRWCTRKQLEQVNSSACRGSTRTDSSSLDRSAPGSSKPSAASISSSSTAPASLVDAPSLELLDRVLVEVVVGLARRVVVGGHVVTLRIVLRMVSAGPPERRRHRRCGPSCAATASPHVGRRLSNAPGGGFVPPTTGGLCTTAPARASTLLQASPARRADTSRDCSLRRRYRPLVTASWRATRPIDTSCSSCRRPARVQEPWRCPSNTLKVMPSPLRSTRSLRERLPP